MKKQNQLHLPYLDGMRGLCALYVVIHHVVIQFIKPIDDKAIKLTYAFFKQGHYAVDIFIVISGFCLMLPLIKSQSYRLKPGFFYKRAKRIYTPYFLAMVLALVLIATVIGDRTGNYWDSCVPVSFKDVWTHFLLIHDIFNDTIYKINYPFWSVSVECRIYLLFPVLLFVWRKFGVLPTLISTVLISAIFLGVSLLGGSNIALKASGVNPYIILFCLGMIAAELSLNPMRKVSQAQLWVTAVCAAVLTGVALVLKQRSNTWLMTELVDLGIGSLFFVTLIFISRGCWLTRILSLKPIVFLGTFAYSIYLLHSIFIQLIWKFAVPANMHVKEQFWGFIIIGVPAILSASYVFFISCERPFMNHKPRRVVITENELLEA